MKRTIRTFAIALAALCGFAGTTFAADIYTPADAYVSPGSGSGAPVTWSGLYVGGAIGYGNANHDLSVRDYFKDYCATNGDLSVGFDEDGNMDVDRFKTVENKTDGRFGDITGDTCETLAKEDSFEAGSHFTVPGDSREIARLNGLNSAGLVGDVRLGYDQQLGSRFVLGVFGTYGFSDMKADGEIVGASDFTLERGDDWSVGARAGVLVNDRTLLYILAAYTETEYDLNVTVGPENFAKTTDFSGVTVGGGIEFALNEGVFLGIEGSHAFYGDENIFDVYDADTNTGKLVNDELGETKIMATIKLKLNSF